MLGKARKLGKMVRINKGDNMQGKSFEELEVGDQFTNQRRTMTETDIVI